MLIQNQVGPPLTSGSLKDGSQPLTRSGNQGDLIASELHGRNYEQTYRKNIYVAASNVAQTVPAGFATTYTGLCLSNPPGSPVNLVINKVGFSTSNIAAGAAFGLMCQASSTPVTHTSALPPYSGFFKAGQPGFGLVDANATLPVAPVLTYVFGTTLPALNAAFPFTAPQMVDLEGSLVLPAGTYMAFFSSTATTQNTFISFEWEEVPL